MTSAVKNIAKGKTGDTAIDLGEADKQAYFLH